MQALQLPTESPKPSVPNDPNDYYWNNHFQLLCEDLNNSSALDSNSIVKQENSMLEKYMKLRDLAQSFITTATHYGKIIIVEKNLSDDKKTIKPLTKSIGGLGNS